VNVNSLTHTSSAWRGRTLVWGGFAIVLLLAPLAVSGGLAVSILSQIGIAIVAATTWRTAA